MNKWKNHREWPEPDSGVLLRKAVSLVFQTVALLDEIFLDFFPSNIESNDAELLLKIDPGMSKEDPA